MIRTFSRMLCACATAAMFAAALLATPAQANVQIPGLNGKIAWMTDRDFPPGPISKGIGPSCFADTANPDCALEIYSMNPDGSLVDRLTNNTSGDGEPAWLPADGSTIAFASNRGDQSNCDGDCYYDIWSMGGDGSSPVQLTNDQSYNFHPTYSPDGTRIAFQGLIPQIDAPRTISADYGTEIFIIPSGGESVGPETALLPADQTGQVSQTTTVYDSWPAWSPDGTKIAFTRLTLAAGKGSQTEDVRTYVAPANGTGPATPVEAYPECIVAAPTAPARDIEAALAQPTLQGMRAALKSRGLIPAGCLWDVKPAWAPDGNKLAATRITVGQASGGASVRGFGFGEDDGDIVVFNSSDGSGDTNLSNLSEPADCNTVSDTPECSVDEYPTWSPNGTKIVFDSNRNQPDGSHDSSQCLQLELEYTCDREIWTMNVDGSGLTRLTNNTADDFFPDWQRIPPPPPAPPLTPPVAPAVVPPKVGVAGVRRACVSRAFHVRFHIATTASSVKSVVVKLDGKKIKTTSKGSFTLTINSKKLKAGRHRLTITATDSNGHVTTTHKSFSVCKAAKPRRKAAPRFTG